MTFLCIRTAAIRAFACATGLMTAAAAQAETTSLNMPVPEINQWAVERVSHGDWTLSCFEDTSDVGCMIFTMVVEDGNFTAFAIHGASPSHDGLTSMMATSHPVRAFADAPLQISNLSSSFIIEQYQPWHWFGIKSSAGTLTKKMQAGDSFTVTLPLEGGRDKSVTLSLKGFTKVWNAYVDRLEGRASVAQASPFEAPLGPAKTQAEVRAFLDCATAFEEDEFKTACGAFLDVESFSPDEKVGTLAVSYFIDPINLPSGSDISGWTPIVNRAMRETSGSYWISYTIARATGKPADMAYAAFAQMLETPDSGLATGRIDSLKTRLIESGLSDLLNNQEDFLCPRAIEFVKDQAQGDWQAAALRDPVVAFVTLDPQMEANCKAGRSALDDGTGPDPLDLIAAKEFPELPPTIVPQLAPAPPVPAGPVHESRSLQIRPAVRAFLESLSQWNAKQTSQPPDPKLVEAALALSIAEKGVDDAALAKAWRAMDDALKGNPDLIAAMTEAGTYPIHSELDVLHAEITLMNRLLLGHVGQNLTDPAAERWQGLLKRAQSLSASKSKTMLDALAQDMIAELQGVGLGASLSAEISAACGRNEVMRCP